MWGAFFALERVFIPFADIAGIGVEIYFQGKAPGRNDRVFLLAGPGLWYG
jgi:hypothetical protein